MNWIKRKLFNWLQAGCQHKDHYVFADILQGDRHGVEVQWCYRCGAYKVMYEKSKSGVSIWHRPDADHADTFPLDPINVS